MLLACRQRLRPTAAFQERRDAWRLSRKAVTSLDQQKSLSLVRAEDPEGHGSDPVNMGSWTLKRVEDAFTGFFSRVGSGRKAGFPRFRSASRWSSFGLLEKAGLRIERGRIHLKDMERGIRLNHDRPLPPDTRLLGVTFTRRERHWFVSSSWGRGRSWPPAMLAAKASASAWRRLPPLGRRAHPEPPPGEPARAGDPALAAGAGALQERIEPAAEGAGEAARHLRKVADTGEICPSANT